MNNKESLCTLSKDLIEQIEKKLVDWEKNIESLSATENAAAISSQSQEFLEQASYATMIDVEMNRAKNQNKLLGEIRLALKKIKQGTYGICEESGDFIEEKRLLANPLARYSLEEQRAMEKNSRRQ